MIMIVTVYTRYTMYTTAYSSSDNLSSSPPVNAAQNCLLEEEV